MVFNANRPRKPFGLTFEEVDGRIRVKGDDDVTRYTADTFEDQTNTFIVLRGENTRPFLTLVAENARRNAQWDAYPTYRTAVLLEQKLFSASRYTSTSQINVAFEKTHNCFGTSDLKVIGSVTAKTCAIYNRDISHNFAQMSPVNGSTDKFSVEVLPGVRSDLVVPLFLAAVALQNNGAVFSPPVKVQPSDEEFSMEGNRHGVWGRVLSLPRNEPLHMPRQVSLSGPVVSVIGPQYTSNEAINIAVDKVTPEEYHVFKEGDQDWSFRISSRNTNLHNQLLLMGADEAPIAMLREKKLTMHNRWRAFRCVGSEAPKNQLFYVLNAKMVPDYTHVNIILGEGKSSDFPDFKVVGNWPCESCMIYTGDFKRKIAQMFPPGEMNKFKVEVYPNVDSAFITALVVIVDAMELTAWLKFASENLLSIAIKAACAALLAGAQYLCGA